eukprot:gb/GEZN01004297.1/.p1 GENE.gb/GEZN01004297.1/~~gb/GEZN01004297.1/.p1  ORF type:complete len:603 (-),score=114.18 gb/GEZN01004297.1/:182-1894(-)
MLPRPQHVLMVREDAKPTPMEETPTFEPPPYGHRQGFKPTAPEDFGDGGAFPEIHMLQYPRRMGKPGEDNGMAVVPLSVDETGAVKYDAVARVGHKAKKHVYSTYDALVPKEVERSELARPDEDEIKKTAERTKAALQGIVDQLQSAAQPTAIPKQNLNEPTYVRYTPAQQGEQWNSGASERIIRIQEMPVDPLDPPKFKHKKIPNAPPSPPAPVLHSPPRKITIEDQQNWKIPPCISNWKNIKGYTIPLDKRLAADGRGLQKVQINDKFAKLSDSLYVAERTARREIASRTKVKQAVMRKQKEAKEDELRTLAARARAAAVGQGEREEAEEYQEEDIEARAEREDIRKDRRRELKRDMRMEQRKVEKTATAAKGAKLRSDRERDVSEKIALGQKVNKSQDSMFDQRLFNQSEGMDAGFGAEDDYNAYDKPLFSGGASQKIYKPTKLDNVGMGEADVQNLIEKSTKRFKPDRGFEGAEEASSAYQARTKPVDFEKDDPFGIGQMLSTAKSGGGGRGTLDKIGSQGHMSASAGGAGQDGDRRRDRVEFEEGSSSTSKEPSRSSKKSRRDRD